MEAKLGDDEDAIETYAKARGVIDMFFKDDLTKRVTFMNKEGLFCFNLGFQDDALKIFKHLMKLLEGSENDRDLPALADCYEHIADILLSLNDYSFALINYKNCLKIRQRYY